MQITFTEAMTRLYNQIADVKKSSLLPYYLFISKDIYDVLRTELPPTAETQNIPREYVSLQFIEGLEVVVFSQPEEGYIEVKGIKVHA